MTYRWIFFFAVLGLVLWYADRMENKEMQKCIAAGGDKVVFGQCYKMVPIFKKEK